ncbi:hypothetical protein BJ742DRAFT_801863 [Cladochytrium replicatum]|nr:hypothetical protein BJ742DRAFT_801863 [Cladochytrium replicatum]
MALTLSNNAGRSPFGLLPSELKWAILTALKDPNFSLLAALDYPPALYRALFTTTHSENRIRRRFETPLPISLRYYFSACSASQPISPALLKPEFFLLAAEHSLLDVLREMLKLRLYDPELPYVWKIMGETGNVALEWPRSFNRLLQTERTLKSLFPNNDAAAFDLLHCPKPTTDFTDPPQPNNTPSFNLSEYLERAPHYDALVAQLAHSHPSLYPTHLLLHPPTSARDYVLTAARNHHIDPVHALVCLHVLHLAARAGRPAILDLVLERNADITPMDVGFWVRFEVEERGRGKEVAELVATTLCEHHGKVCTYGHPKVEKQVWIVKVKKALKKLMGAKEREVQLSEENLLTAEFESDFDNINAPYVPTVCPFYDQFGWMDLGDTHTSRWSLPFCSKLRELLSVWRTPREAEKLSYRSSSLDFRTLLSSLA